MVRVTLVGAESTGKTVLAAALARHFGAPWVREYGRDITEAKIHNAGGDISKLTWSPSDFVEIAQGQLKLEDAATTGNTHPQQLLICDTCILTTWIWSEFLVGSQDVQLKELMESREHSYTLYILMNIDVCWIDDGTRLAPDTEWFHKRFLEELQNRSLPHVVVSGKDWDARTKDVISTIENIIAKEKK